MYSNFPENDYRNYLMHWGKGEKAPHHKYLYIDKNGNYVYPEDVARNAGNAIKGAASRVSGAAKKAALGVGAKAYAATSGVRRSLASRSEKNRQRAAYKSDGKSTLQRARGDINNIWQKEYGPSSGSTHKRTLKERFGATKAAIGNRTSSALNRITSSKIYDRARGVLNTTSNKASRAVGNAATKARFKIRRTRINMKNSARSLYNRAKNVLGNTRVGKYLKNRRQAKKNGKLTGGGAR